MRDQAALFKVLEVDLAYEPRAEVAALSRVLLASIAVDREILLRCTWFVPDILSAAYQTKQSNSAYGSRDHGESPRKGVKC
jgi:hypothetical protein